MSITLADIRQLLQDSYGFAPNSFSVTLFRDGPDNLLYVVEGKKDGQGYKYALREPKRLKGAAVAFEVEVLNHLAQHGLPVPQPIANVVGELFTIVDAVPFILFTYLAGESGERYQQEKPPLPLVRQAGSLLAQLHLIGKDLPPLPARARTVFSEYERIFGAEKQAFMEKMEGGYHFLQEAREFYEWGKLQPAEISVLSNDYHPGNIMVAGGKITGLLEFDWACLGPTEKDVALALACWALPSQSDDVYWDVFDEFLVGYNEVAPVAMVKDAQLKKWLRFACISDACTYFSDRQEHGESVQRALGCHSYYKAGVFAADTSF